MLASRLNKIPKYLLAFVISTVFPIKKKMIVLWTTFGYNYSCTPCALTALFDKP